MRRLVYVLAMLALWVTLAPAAAQTQTEGAVDKAIAYVRTQQQPDGSFAGLGSGSTADAIFALVAAGEDVAAVEKNGTSALDFIGTQSADVGKPENTGVAAKYALALLAAGRPTKLADGMDLIDIVDQSYNGDTGRYGADITAHAYAIMALVAAENNVPDKAVEALRSLQRPDGGWSFDGTSDSDTNTTALAVQALVAAGEKGDTVRKAVDYYRAQQNSDGGFPYSQTSPYGNASDANSTALGIQALLAAGETLSNWQKNGASPLDRLLGFQNESGAFRFQDTPPDDNAFATYQAVPAIASKTLPLRAGASRLPNTGAVDLLPLYALTAVALLLGGVTLRRRNA